jgi:hypothetical protein
MCAVSKNGQIIALLQIAIYESAKIWPILEIAKILYRGEFF